MHRLSPQHEKLPVFNQVTIDSAHSVRTLRQCEGCDGLGHVQTMIAQNGHHFHGRCFIGRYGIGRFWNLPKAETDKLTLGDIGAEVMRGLVKKSDTSSGR